MKVGDVRLKIPGGPTTEPLLGYQSDDGLPARARSSTTSSFQEDNRPAYGCLGRFRNRVSVISSKLCDVKGSLVAGATLVGGVAAQILDIFTKVKPPAWANFTSAAVIGISSRALITSNSPVVLRPAMGMGFGYTTMTFLAQLYWNVSDLDLPSWVEPLATTGIIVCAFAQGTNFVIFYWLQPQKEISGGGTAKPSQSEAKRPQATLKEIPHMREVRFSLYGSLSIASTVGACIYPAKEVRAFLSFFAPYWSMRLFSEVLKSIVNEKVHEGSRQMKRLKTFLDTIAPGLIISSFGAIALYDQLEAFIAAGGVVGFSEGTLEGSSYDRFFGKRVPIEQLSEFLDHPAEKTPIPGYLRLKYAYLGLTLAWFSSFVAWQEGWDLKGQPEARIELWCFAGSFFIVLTTTTGIQRIWIKKERIEEENPSALKDALVCWSLDPQICGVPFLYLFIVALAASEDFTNLGGEEVKDQFALFTRRLGYVGFGGVLGSECNRDILSRFIGVDYRGGQSYTSLAAIIQGVITGAHKLLGKIP